MRRFLLPAFLLAALTLPASAASAPVFLVRGHGWGHGIGMPQWGAYGFAQQGWNYRQILAHYYRGTAIGNAPVSSVQVLLASGRQTLTVGSAASFKAGTHLLAPGSYAVTRTVDGRIQVTGMPQTLASPASFTATSAPLELGGAAYRGSLEVRANGALSAVNQVSIDDYVRGVVPREVPYTWLTEVLKAQAVAARSYALATPGHCGGLLCPDVRDQVYGGVAAERPSTNDAVSATAGEVVLYNGAVAQTFFHSSSGGKTASSVDEWGGNVGYLQAVDDPYDVISPHHNWELAPMGARALGRKLQTGAPRDLSIVRNASDRVKSLTVTNRAGIQTTLSGATVRFRLDLRSTWFTISRLAIAANPTTSVCRRRVTLSVAANGLRRVALEQQPVTGGAWTRLRLERIEGQLQARHRPCVSTRYRLVTASFTGAGTMLPVAPRVNFTLRQPSGGLRGVVRPRLVGIPVAVQRQEGAGWVAVAKTRVRADGTFLARFAVTAGVYRAKVRPPARTGLVPGFSPPLTLTFSR
ncbi:MAG: SpoIID/LytB domain-containing protein [Gaiellaceae bacterium]